MYADMKDLAAEEETERGSSRISQFMQDRMTMWEEQGQILNAEEHQDSFSAMMKNLRAKLNVSVAAQVSHVHLYEFRGPRFLFL